jgi:hypothetical protein
MNNDLGSCMGLNSSAEPQQTKHLILKRLQSHLHRKFAGYALYAGGIFGPRLENFWGILNINLFPFYKVSDGNLYPYR